MRLPMLAVGAVLVLGLEGCDKIPFLSKDDAAATDTTPAAPAATQAPEPQQTAVEPPPPQPRPATAQRPLVDEPWMPIDTGTVHPGMTREQVIAHWGPPVLEREVGTRMFLYFRNGCEASCGTHDIVFLEDGQVVDAVVRGEGHTYGGVSSSPRERQAEFTPPVPSGGAEEQP